MGEKRSEESNGVCGGGGGILTRGNFLFGWKQLLLERDNLLGGKIPGLFFILGEVSLYFCCIGVV